VNLLVCQPLIFAGLNNPTINWVRGTSGLFLSRLTYMNLTYVSLNVQSAIFTLITQPVSNIFIEYKLCLSVSKFFKKFTIVFEGQTKFKSSLSFGF
jgi:hypothetical protein